MWILLFARRKTYVDVSLLVTQEEVVHDGAVVEVLQRRHVLHPSDAAVVHELHLLPREGVLLVGVDLEEQKIRRFCDGRHWFPVHNQFKKHRENIERWSVTTSSPKSGPGCQFSAFYKLPELPEQKKMAASKNRKDQNGTRS